MPDLPLQVKYLNKGAYGCVVLAHDNITGEECALKFIKRGAQVRLRLRCGGVSDVLGGAPLGGAPLGGWASQCAAAGRHESLRP